MKTYLGATCKHCGKLTDISLSHDVRRLVADNKTLTEQLILNGNNFKLVHRMKNGEVAALHKMIAELWLKIPEEHKKEMFEKQQSLRDELKSIKKKYLTKVEVPK